MALRQAHDPARGARRATVGHDGGHGRIDNGASYTTRLLTADTWDGFAALVFTQFGFARDRRIAMWRWVMRLRIPPAPAPAQPPTGGGRSGDRAT